MSKNANNIYNTSRQLEHLLSQGPLNQRLLTSTNAILHALKSVVPWHKGRFGKGFNKALIPTCIIMKTVIYYDPFVLVSIVVKIAI